MTRRILIAMFVAFVVSPAALTRAQTPPGSSDEEAVRSVVAATTDAFSRHDAKA